MPAATARMLSDPLATLTAVALAAVVAAPPARGQQEPAPAPAAAPAAQAEPRIEWQRTLGDALAVQQATGLPLLIAVNMDGEVFNDAFATRVYRDPKFVAATRGYVCVVASPDRHTERDYDAAGNRVECPRFPGCTCSEHIAIEPELFARWFDGTRNAPRHLAVSKDGKVLFDRFLDRSMQTAIDAITRHAGDANAQPRPTQDLAELFRRRDALARRTVEAKWRDGDATARKALLAAAANAGNEPADLMRAALRSEDDATFAAGAAALARIATVAMRIDVEDALARVAGVDPEAERALVARLAELGAHDEGAARLARHFAPGEPAPLPPPWTNAWTQRAFDPADRASVEAELDRCEAALRADAGDDEARLRLATAQLAFAEVLVREGGKGPELWFQDAAANARKVTAAGLEPEVQAVVACASWLTGDAAAAGKALARAFATTSSGRRPAAFLAARLLDVAVQVTTSQAFAAPDAATRVLRAEIDRVIALLDALGQRQALTESALLTGASLLEFAGLRARARSFLGQAAALFPESVTVHERWRARLFVDLGANGMRRAYAAWQRAHGSPAAAWFAGYASLVAAEQHTRDQRAADALAAYGEAVDRFVASAEGNQDFADSAHHYAVLALAGRAELLAAAGDLERACADLLRAHGLRPDSLDTSDGLERKPRAIAGRVAAAAERAGRTELAQRLAPLLP